MPIAPASAHLGRGDDLKSGVMSLLSPKDVPAPFPPVRRTHDSSGSIHEVVREEIAIERETLELLAER